MIPSSALCRAQESLHRRRAADTLLENVRAVATNAALAWEQEAISAERREDRQVEVRRLSAATLRKRAAADELPNENPDRGLATVNP